MATSSSSSPNDLETTLALAIANVRKKLKRRGDTAEQSREWKKLVLAYRSFVIATCSEDIIPKILLFPLDTWMLHHLPTDDYLRLLIREAFEHPPDTTAFSYLTSGNQSFISCTLEHALRVMEHYALMVKTVVVDVASGESGGVDEEATPVEQEEKKDERPDVEHLWSEFLSENVKKEPGVEVHDFTVFFCWCAFVYGKLQKDMGLWGRRKVISKLQEEPGVEKIKGRYIIMKGLRVRGVEQSPWLPIDGGGGGGAQQRKRRSESLDTSDVS